MKPFYVYILKCSDQSYYIGHTDDIDRRIAEHRLGEPACYTSSRLPIQVVFIEEFATRDEALIMERTIKKWSRAKKEALIQKNFEKLILLSKKNFR